MRSEVSVSSMIDFGGPDADERWLREVYDSQWAALVRLAGLLLGDSERAEEIAQDAIVATYARRRQFEDGVPVAYLRRCVVNACRSVQRHRTVRRRSWVPLLMERDEPEQPHVVTERHDERTRVLAALRSLPTRQQEVLVLRFYQHLSEAEIADSLGISRGRSSPTPTAASPHCDPDWTPPKET